MHKLPANDEGVREALCVLGKGGVVAHATETCYGLACDLTNLAAVEKLFAIKKRPQNQPVSVLFPSVEETKRYVVWNTQAEELARENLPGPLTLILPLRNDLPTPLFPTPSSRTEDTRETRSPRAEVPTVGIRISSHPIASTLARCFGRPLSTTSANIHGRFNVYSAEEIQRQFESDVNGESSVTLSLTKGDRRIFLILDSGPIPPTPPSTVIDCTKESPRTIRSGSVCI